MKDVRDKLNVELMKAQKASQPQHLANDIEARRPSSSGKLVV